MTASGLPPWAAWPSRDEVGEGGDQAASVWKRLRVVTTVKYRLK